MTLPRETLLELMALADGELEGAAKERIERLAAHDAEARQVVETMRSEAIRVWLRHSATQRTAADGIADAVMKKLDTERPAALGGASGPRRSRSPRFLVAGATLAGTLALAASVAIVLHGARDRERPAPVASTVAPRAVGSPVEPPVSVAAAPPRAPKQEGAQGVEVEEVDSPGHVSIFAIGNASAPSSVVVWIDDEPVEK